MACDPLIDDGFVFPRRANNRPALPHIGYRIGRYDDFVEAMLRRIDAALPLAAWTHREPDDPGIALLQGAAILGDILSFYQEHYANEAYLRTAAWRESVAELVRLTGYRLAPGPRRPRDPGLRGCAARQPVTIREGFPVKADLQDVPDAGRLPDRGRADRAIRISAASISIASASRTPTHRRRRDDDRADRRRRRRPIRSAWRPSS